MNKSDKNKVSSDMLKFAWTLEGILCVTGVLIAISLSYIAINSEENKASIETWLILIMGSLPLIGVALTELMKIPLVKGFLYSNSLRAKFLAAVGLAAVCILTFETMLSGQERMFSTQQKQINIQKQDENRMMEQIQLIDNQIISIQGLTPGEIKKQANEGIQAQLEAINEQIDDLRAREESLITSNNSAEVSELLRQVEQLEDSKRTLIENQRINLKEINNEKLSLNSDEQNELENAGFFRKSGVGNKFVQRREELETRRSSLTDTFHSEIDSADRSLGKLNRKIAKLSEPSESLKTSLEVLASQIIDLQSDKNEIIKSNNKQVELSVMEAKNSKATISALLIKKVKLTEELNQTRDSLAIASGNSVIHSLAGKFYGVENLADLSKDQVGKFALIFMFSVAGVVSLIGPVVAFIAVTIQLQEEEKKPNYILRSMRYVFVSLIKRFRSPKIVTKIKEVEIEKEVIKEVMVEKIKYEEVIKPKPVEIPIFVQVPVPTDPKDLPKMEELTQDNLKPISAIGGLN